MHKHNCHYTAVMITHKYEGYNKKQIIGLENSLLCYIVYDVSCIQNVIEKTLLMSERTFIVAIDYSRA